ncbi:hypothetical protein PMAYCL1PPCAC_02583, partial [Pristionchus mayeri]
MEIDISSDRLTAVVEDQPRSPNSLSPDPHGFSMSRKKSMKERMQEIEEKRNRKKKGKKKEEQVMSIFDAAMLIKNINPQRIDLISANIQNEFGVCGWILTILSYILIFFTLPISACMCIKVVQEYERAVIFRLGRLMPGGAKGPGIFFIVPCIDTYRKVDLRVLSFEVPPQEILSKDSVTVAVDAVVYFRISNATISVTNVEDAARSTKLLAQTTLRNILGTKTLAEMLSDREAISHQMQSTLDEATEPWGVKVERVEVKDVRLPVQLQRAMAAEAEAAREARAKVIVAEGEQKASRALKEAAEVIAESPSALQLRYLQTLNSISAEKNSTIIFPFPIDLLSAFLQRSAPKSTVQSRSTAMQQQVPCELRQRLGSDSSSSHAAPTAPSSSQQYTTTYSSTTSTWKPRPSPLTGLSDTTTTVVRRGLGEVSIDIERNPSGEEEPPPLPKKIRSCCLYKYPDWVQGMVGEGRPPTSGHGHSHGGTMGPPPPGSSMNTTTTMIECCVCDWSPFLIVAPPSSPLLSPPPMCWRIKNAKYLTEEIPLCKDEEECMREAAYQSSAYSMPGPSQPPSQLDPGSLYDWRRSGGTSSAAAAVSAPSAIAAGGGAKRASVTGAANVNTLLKQAIANRMIKEPKEGMKEEMKEEEKEEKEGDEMSTSLVMSAAWYRDDEGKTGFKNREWEKAKKIQKSAVKEKEKKKMEESRSTVEEIDKELLKKEGDNLSIQSGESSKSKKEKKEEKKEKERLEKEKKKMEKEEKKKEKERMKAEEKEKKEEEKKEKERRKRSVSPKEPKIEKAEKEKEKRESNEMEEKEESRQKKKEEKRKKGVTEERAGKPPKDPTKLKKTRSKESSASSRTMKISDSPRNLSIGERRDSSMSESSRISAISHKSVKFNDRIQVNEIERNDEEEEEESSSDDGFALMSDQEMKRLRDAAAARQAPPPAAGYAPSGHAHFDEDYGYEQWGDAGSGDYVDLDQLPVSVRRAIELEYSSRLAALRSANGRGDDPAAGSMTRLHGGEGESLLSFPLLPRSASGYFEDPLRDSYIHAINNEAQRRMEVEREARRREEVQLLQMTQHVEMQEAAAAAAAGPPRGLPTADLSGSFYDNVQGRVESESAAKSPTANSELFSYAPRRRQHSEVLPARDPDAAPAAASPTPSQRSADRAAFFATMQQGAAGSGGGEKEGSSSVERVFGKSEGGSGLRIDILEATPPPEGWSEAEERMRRKFVERFGARKAPVAESEFTRRGSDAESCLSTDSRESVVSATSLRAEPAFDLPLSLLLSHRSLRTRLRYCILLSIGQSSIDV